MRSFFDSVADIYDETRGLPKVTMDEIIDIMVEQLRNCERVLDLGVGTGRFADPLNRAGINIWGVDISQTMLKKAQNKGLGNLILGDACVLPFKDSSFDSVICVHVLHLVESCGVVLREIKRVGGTTLLSVINKNSQFNALNEYRNALSECAYNLKHPGIREVGLKEILPPKKEIPIKPFQDVKSIGERLELLQERKHSYTQNTPHEAHELAIAHLKSKHHEKLNLHSLNEVEVVVWDIRDLQDTFSI
jgi:ubiquinone/menaquinone biosynthesis C-methylase UbiE